MGQPEAEAWPASQGFVRVEGEGASSTFAALEAKDVLLAGAGGSFFCTAAEALLQVTGVRQCAPQVAVTGDAVWEVSVTQGAPVTAASIKCRLALALAREHITLVTGRPLTAAVASLASTLQVTAPVPILAFLTLQPAGVGRADARASLGVAGVVCVSAVTGCAASILEGVEAMGAPVALVASHPWRTVTAPFIRALIRGGACCTAATGQAAVS